MPKLKPTQTQEMTRFITNNVKSRAGLLGIYTDKELCKRICMDEGTFRNRKRKPELWSVGELSRVAVALKCSLLWLVAKHEEKITDSDKGGG